MKKKINDYLVDVFGYKLHNITGLARSSNKESFYDYLIGAFDDNPADGMYNSNVNFVLQNGKWLNK